MTDPAEAPPSLAPKHRAGFDPAVIAQKRATLLKLTIAAIVPAMVVSGWGMWTFFHDLGRIPVGLIVPMFLLFDLAAIACAWGARISRIIDGRMGVQGWLVWLFAIASGLMSASDSAGRESAVRFAAPMVAAILFELLIRGERRDITQYDSPIDRIRRRVMARLGLLDDVDQDDETAAMTRMAAKLATLAYRAHETRDGTRRRTWAVRRYHRRLRIATERMGFATNDDMVEEVRLHLDALYSSMTGTSAAAVAGLNVWQAAPEPEPAPITKVATFAQAAAPEPTPRPAARISPARRPQRTGRLAGRVPAGKRAQTAVAPAPATAPTQPAPAPAPVPAAAALNGHAQTVTSARIPAPVPPPPPRPKTTTARQSRQARGNSNDADFQKAFLYFQSERQAGRTPSGKDIAAQVGKSRATGNRLLAKIEKALP